MATVADYVDLLKNAEQLGIELIKLIKGFAAINLTPAELITLEAAWKADVDRTKQNAGL
jgi:hypothetical protein